MAIANTPWFCIAIIPHYMLRRRREDRDLSWSSPEPEQWPVVTVQLPIFDERYVAERLIEAVARLDYPTDRLEVQVLDDSTDEVRNLAAAAVYNPQKGGLEIHYLHGEKRSGYKAGALEYGLRQARGELIAVFDADFVPPASRMLATGDGSVTDVAFSVGFKSLGHFSGSFRRHFGVSPSRWSQQATR